MKIGSGNFGSVYRARHLELDTCVAVKVLQASVASQPEALARFRREGISACRVRHPNAVTVLDFGVTPAGIAFLVMELLEGRSLAEELQERGRLSPRRCGELLKPVCDALAVAHSAGIVHRDVKPSNIYLQRTAQGEVVKVVDFGIAKIAGEASPGHDLTLDGQIFGTLAYLAPERFRRAVYDGQSDVYSLAVTLFQMLTGRLPFEPPALEPLAVVAMHLSDPPPPLRQVDSRVPRGVEDVVLRALAKDPAMRPTVEELGRCLIAAAGEESPDEAAPAAARNPSEAPTGSLAAPTGPGRRLTASEDEPDTGSR